MGRFGDGDLIARTEEYALRAITLFRHLRKVKYEDAWIMGRQYFGAATSVGANLVEADAAETRKDFIHKCGIALKETRECRYWLRLVQLAELVTPKRLDPLLDETDQLISILIAIIVKAKRNPKGKD
jgi:four helix bundle protein